MAKRGRLTTDEVLENWESFETDTTEVEEWEGLDRIREPVMAGSDDEFSDLENLEERENTPEVQGDMQRDMDEGETANQPDSDGLDTQPIPPHARDVNAWSSPVPVLPLHPHVGPTTIIPESPLDALLLTFTPELISMIVRETNTCKRSDGGRTICHMGTNH